MLIVSFNYVVTHKGVVQMRGGLTQATAFLISRFGSVDDGISAGVKILPEWLANSPNTFCNSSPSRFPNGRYGIRPNSLF